METVFILIGTWVLYLRTWCGKNRHYYIIDDIVRRWDYLYVVPTHNPPPSFFSEQPHPWRHFFLVLVHSLNIIVINELFGWQTAALFAFCPYSVNGAAWITGGYYAVTAFLTLTAYFFITTMPNILGVFLGSLFFTAALGSTITCLGFPFIFLFAGTPWALTLFWPVTMYLFGKRFRTGYAIRRGGKVDPITLKKIFVMTKVMAYYVRLMALPNRLAFFRSFGYEYGKSDAVTKKMQACNTQFWMSLLAVVVFGVAGYIINPLGTIWFLVTLAPFTQYKMLGQFVAERYLYLPQIGFLMILSTLLSPYPILLTIVLTAYMYRSHLYIPAFRTLENLYKNGVANYPESVANYANLGERYLHTGKTNRAKELLEEGLKLAPTDFLCHVNLAAY